MSTPTFLSYYTPNTILVTKYIKSSNKTDDQIIYSMTLNGTGKIERVLTPNEYYIFTGLDSSSLSVTTTNFKSHNCTDIYIEDTPNTIHKFSDIPNEFFSTNVNEIKGYIYSAMASQKISWEIGNCTNCPIIQLFEGPNWKFNIPPNSISSYTQQSSYPLLLVFHPPNRTDLRQDLQKVYINVSSNAPLYASHDYLNSINYCGCDHTPFIVKNVYVGNIIAYVSSSIMLLIGIIILIMSANISHCSHLSITLLFDRWRSKYNSSYLAI